MAEEMREATEGDCRAIVGWKFATECPIAERYLAVSGIPRFAFATRITCVVKASIQTFVNRAGRPSLRNKSRPAISW